jgi:hypothetical protein
MNTLYSNEVQQAINLGREHHYRFRVVGKNGTIDKPLPKEGWWYYPATDIPRNAQKRVDMLDKSGVSIKQVIIGHEASRLLKAPPKPNLIPIKKAEIQKPKKDPVDLSIVADVLATTFKLALGVATVAVGITVWIMGAALSTALMLDPTVIVVLEDGTWLECMSWYE